MRAKNGKRKIVLAAGAGVLFIAANIHAVRSYVPFPGRPKRGRRLVVCVGDSITFGAGVIHTRRRDAWPSLLGSFLGGDFQVMNFGFSGATAQRDGDLPYRKLSFWRDIQKLHAEICLMMLGTNDSKPYNWNAERYEHDMRDFIEEFRQHHQDARLVLMVPPKAFPGKDGVIGFDIRDDVICSEIAPLLRRLAEEYVLPIVDLYTFTADHPEFFSDGVHPNRFGNRMLAEHIFHYLKV